MIGIWLTRSTSQFNENKTSFSLKLTSSIVKHLHPFHSSRLSVSLEWIAIHHSGHRLFEKSINWWVCSVKRNEARRRKGDDVNEHLEKHSSSYIEYFWSFANPVVGYLGMNLCNLSVGRSGRSYETRMCVLRKALIFSLPPIRALTSLLRSRLYHSWR